MIHTKLMTVRVGPNNMPIGGEKFLGECRFPVNPDSRFSHPAVQPGPVIIKYENNLYALLGSRWEITQHAGEAEMVLILTEVRVSPIIPASAVPPLSAH